MSWRSGAFGKRPARIANCSGYHGDPANEMYKQVTKGEVDFVTGDYLAEVNMANNAEAFAQGRHPGYEETAWEGLQLAMDTIAQKHIKVAINGGALNPAGLALKAAELIEARGYSLKVAYVSGDDLLSKVGGIMPIDRCEALPHLDSVNKNVAATDESFLFTRGGSHEIVSANAYLGAHAIYEAFTQGADIIICGRVSDASPVMACAWYWWSWQICDYDRLAGALVTGHLIECSAYVTGGNFCGFDAYDLELLVDPGYPIAEIDQDGSCVITKHPGTGGLVTVDTCRAQLLYELQGNVYLNSDVTAYLDAVTVNKIGTDRVSVSGIKGGPPPSTTKLAIFYKGGHEVQLLFNASGYGTSKKRELFEKQVRRLLGEEVLSRMDVFEIQQIGEPAPNPVNQNSSTVYFRIFAQSTDIDALIAISRAVRDISLKHFSGFHSSMDMRTAIPRPYLGYYPALWPQSNVDESVHFVNRGGVTESFSSRPAPHSEDLVGRDSYDTTNPVTLTGTQRKVRIGDIVLGRSGDKGSNLNSGLFVQTHEEWEWLRSFFSREKLSELIGEDAQSDFAVERVEFPGIYAVHFVVYGILGRGVSSSKRLDGFGKGFVDYLRDKVVDVPESLCVAKGLLDDEHGD